MKHKRIALSGILMFGLGLAGLQAQTMQIKENSGTQTAFPLQTVRKMTFSSGNLSVQKTDNTSGVYALSGVRYVCFSNTPADIQAPTAPTSLSSTAKTAVSVSLSWAASTDNVGVAGYCIYQDGVNVATVSGTSYTATALTANTAYTFTVKAIDAASNISAASSAVTVTTSVAADTQAPTAPTSLSSTAKTSASVSLSWAASTDNVGVAGYCIYQDGVKVATVSGTSYTATALSANTAYTFTVKAIDAASNISVASSAVVVTTSVAADTQAPTVPTSLSSTAKTAASVSLSWAASTDNVGVAGYCIYQDGVNVATVSGTSYTATALSANTAYTFTVKAIDAASNISAASNAVTVTTSVAADIQAPTAPASLSTTAKTATSVSLSWAASTDNVGVAGYCIYQDGVKVATVSGTSYTATALTANTAYTFTVKAIDAASNISAASSAVTVTTSVAADTQAPTAPTSLSSTAKTSASVSLSWAASTDNVGVAGYCIYQDGVKVATVSGTSYTATALSANTAYTFTVKAIDAASNISVASSAVVVTTSVAADTQAPTVPTSLSSTAKTAASVSLSWAASTDNVGVAGYCIYQDGVNVATVSGTSYTATALSANTAYTFTVKAIDAASNISAASNAVTVTTSVAADIQAPTAPASLSTTAKTATSVSLSWAASTDNVGVAGYCIYQDGVKVATVSGTSYTATALSANTAYTFTVKAIDAASNISAASNVVTVTTSVAADIQAPTAPASLSTTAKNATSVSLSWAASTDNVGVTEYYIYQDGVKVGTVTSTSYIAVALTANTAYTFTVKAIDAASNISAASSAVTVTTSTATGIYGSDKIDGNTLQAYPNPVTDILSVDLTAAQEEGSISILTMDGALVLIQKTNGACTAIINLSQLAQGKYLCRYTSNTETKTTTIIKQ